MWLHPSLPSHWYMTEFMESPSVISHTMECWTRVLHCSLEIVCWVQIVHYIADIHYSDIHDFMQGPHRSQIMQIQFPNLNSWTHLTDRVSTALSPRGLSPLLVEFLSCALQLLFWHYTIQCDSEYKLQKRVVEMNRPSFFACELPRGNWWTTVGNRMLDFGLVPLELFSSMTISSMGPAFHATLKWPPLKPGVSHTSTKCLEEGTLGRGQKWEGSGQTSVCGWGGKRQWTEWRLWAHLPPKQKSKLSRHSPLRLNTPLVLIIH